MTPEQAYWKILDNIFDRSSTFTFYKEEEKLKLKHFGFKYGSAHVDVYYSDEVTELINIHLYYSIDESSWSFWLQDVNEEMIQKMVMIFNRCFLENIVEDIELKKEEEQC